jgi:hypothetical protein
VLVLCWMWFLMLAMSIAFEKTGAFYRLRKLLHFLQQLNAVPILDQGDR